MDRADAGEFRPASRHECDDTGEERGCGGRARCWGDAEPTCRISASWLLLARQRPDVVTSRTTCEIPQISNLHCFIGRTVGGTCYNDTLSGSCIRQYIWQFLLFLTLICVYFYHFTLNDFVKSSAYVFNINITMYCTLFSLGNKL